MTIQKEARRVEAGRSLTTLHSQGIDAIAVLEGIKTNLVTLKTNMGTDTDYTEVDTVEVQAVISDLSTRISALKA